MIQTWWKVHIIRICWTIHNIFLLLVIPLVCYSYTFSSQSFCWSIWILHQQILFIVFLSLFVKSNSFIIFSCSHILFILFWMIRILIHVLIYLLLNLVNLRKFSYLRILLILNMFNLRLETFSLGVIERASEDLLQFNCFLWILSKLLLMQLSLLLGKRLISC